MKNKTLTGSIMIVLAIILSTGAISYAYFLARVNNAESSTTISGTSGSMSIAFADSSNSISAGYLTPSATEFATKTFTITGDNTTPENMYYALSVVTASNGFADNSIKYSITGTNTSGSGTLVENKNLIGILSGNNTNNIGSGYFSSGTSLVHTYTIKFYYPETDSNQSTEMNSTINAYINLTNNR